MSAPTDQLAEWLREQEEKAAKADAKINALCNGRERWRMSIPAKPDSDPDLVISVALASVPVLLGIVKEYQKALEEYAESGKWAHIPCQRHHCGDTAREALARAVDLIPKGE